MAAASLLWSLPMVGMEVVTHGMYWPTWQGWAIAVAIAFGPSFTGQLAYMRGVDLIGPARAGLFANLIPISGAICAVVILGESFTSAHAIAVALGLAGIALAEIPPRRARPLQLAEPSRDPALP